jgi:hypothetical protein
LQLLQPSVDKYPQVRSYLILLYLLWVSSLKYYTSRTWFISTHH